MPGPLCSSLNLHHVVLLIINLGKRNEQVLSTIFRLPTQIMFCCQAVTKVTGLVMSSVLGHHVTDRCHGVAQVYCLATGNF